MKKYLYPMTAVHVMEAQNFLAVSMIGPDKPVQGGGGGNSDDPSGDY